MRSKSRGEIGDGLGQFCAAGSGVLAQVRFHWGVLADTALCAGPLPRKRGRMQSFESLSG
jgi:hypothetical protein